MIGPVHRIAAVMDQRFSIDAAVLSSQPDRSLAEGRAIGLSAERCYGSVEEMIEKERLRGDGIEALAIITPNDSHARYLRLALQRGLDARQSTHLARPGHPEGLQEAVANLYCGLADMMLSRRGHAPSEMPQLTPSVSDGVAGPCFVMACLESSARDGAVVPLPAVRK